MGSLMPGWEQSVSPDAQAHGDQVPEWLSSVRKSGNVVRTYSLRDKHVVRVSTDSAERDYSEDPRSPSQDVPMGSPMRGVGPGSPMRRATSLKRNSVPAKLSGGHDKDAEPATQRDDEHIRWWTRIDSSSFNQKDMDDIENYRKGSYKPQHDIAKLGKQQGAHPVVVTVEPEIPEVPGEESPEPEAVEPSENAAPAAAQ